MRFSHDRSTRLLLNKFLLVFALLTMVGGVSYGQTSFTLRPKTQILSKYEKDKWVTNDDETITLQGTHEQRNIIYIGAGSTKTLEIPTTKIQAYQRW